MKKLLVAVALTLTITPSVLAQAGTNECHDTVFITKIKLQKQEAERQMFLYKPRK